MCHAPCALTGARALEPPWMWTDDASRRGDVELTKRLLKMKADVNFRGEKFGNTALMIACKRSHLLAVQLLVVRQGLG